MIRVPLSPEPRLISTEAQKIGQLLLEGLGVGVLVAVPARRGCSTLFAKPLHQRLDLAHIEAVIDDVPRQGLGVVAADQRARMPGRQRPSCTMVCTPAGSFNRRSVLATWLRLLPMISESCSWL